MGVGAVVVVEASLTALVDRVSISPENPWVAVGGQVGITAQAFDVNGAPVTVFERSFWGGGTSHVTAGGSGLTGAVGGVHPTSAEGEATLMVGFNGQLFPFSVTVTSHIKGVIHKAVDSQSQPASRVELVLEKGGTEIARAVTDGSGGYRFNGLFEGSYTVKPVLDPELFHASPSGATVALSQGTPSGQADFSIIDGPATPKKQFSPSQTVLYLPFSVTVAGSFDLETIGTNQIDPYIRLYNNACFTGACLGTFLDADDDGGTPSEQSITFNYYNSLISGIALGVGGYTVVMSAFSLSDSKARAGSQTVCSTSHCDDDNDWSDCTYEMTITSGDGVYHAVSASLSAQSASVANVTNPFSKGRSGVSTVEGGRALSLVLRAAAVQAHLGPGPISDFEDGALSSKFGAGWAPSTDEITGGTSTVELIPEGGALTVRGEVGAGATSRSGAMFFPGGTPMDPADVSAGSGVRFRVRGEGLGLTVMMFAQNLGEVPAALERRLSAEWTTVEIPFTEFEHADPSGLLGIFIGVSGEAGDYRIEIDDVEIYLGGQRAPSSAVFGPLRPARVREALP